MRRDYSSSDVCGMRSRRSRTNMPRDLISPYELLAIDYRNRPDWIRLHDHLPSGVKLHCRHLHPLCSKCCRGRDISSIYLRLCVSSLYCTAVSPSRRSLGNDGLCVYGRGADPSSVCLFLVRSTDPCQREMESVQCLDGCHLLLRDTGDRIIFANLLRSING